MIYLVILMVIFVVVLGMFALAKGEGEMYSKNHNSARKGDDHFNSFTL
ncbi:MAG: hypothetical protein ACK40M_09560 [Flavobacteriales bacterium]